MFIGHFGLAFGAKRIAPTVSLGLLFAACQLADLLWPTLLLLGIARDHRAGQHRGDTARLRELPVLAQPAHVGHLGHIARRRLHGAAARAGCGRRHAVPPRPQPLAAGRADAPARHAAHADEPDARRPWPVEFLLGHGRRRRPAVRRRPGAVPSHDARAIARRGDRPVVARRVHADNLRRQPVFTAASIGDHGRMVGAGTVAAGGLGMVGRSLEERRWEREIRK